MDKIGPICRAVEDCALVLSAIYGPDGHDLAVQPAAFNWDAAFDWKALRVGYLKSAFDPAPPFVPHPPDPTLSGKELADATDREARSRHFDNAQAYDLKYAAATLDVLKKMGVTLLPVELPDLPYGAITPLLSAEGAAAFDTLTRSGRDQLLTGQRPGDWPNSFRVAHLYSAVDYIQANRARSLVIAGLHRLFQQVDVIVTPSQGPQLSATNLSGHPAVIVPNGLRGPDAPRPISEADASPDNIGGPGTPVSITFLGALYSDARLAAFARAYQNATDFHLHHPPL
jgi:Asp-tRNA(Asn)/Glu-tRNA(Gln) amidotransferase A subunit family amidase